MASGNSNGNSRKFLSPDNFLVIQGWMVTELALKGNELLIYALIYGFSQAEDQWFDGTLKYIAEWTNSTVRGVQKSISSLVEKNLIEKDEITKNKIKSCRYRVWNNVHGGIEQSSWGYRTKFMGGIEQSSPHDNINNNINNNTPYTQYSTSLRIECSPQGDPPQNGSDEKKSRKDKNSFVPPTLEEVTAYCASRGNKVDPKKFYEYYNAVDWIDAKGEKVKSWKHKCITWELSQNKNSTSADESTGSFDTDEFFEAAVKASYESILEI
jgi:hypothetical protein